MRHAQLLGAQEPLMWRLVPVLVREMGQAYPELVRAQALIEETLKLEETRFRRTLVRGLAILDDETKSLKTGDKLKGETAFTLYDTYGFPLDLTQDALKSRGIAVDTAGFERAMELQREKARAAWAGSGEAATETVWFGVREKSGATEFLGYETEDAEGVVRALVKNGAEVNSLEKGEEGAIVLNQTPFYAESGGQVGDTGILEADGVRFRVTDTQKKAGDLFAHFGKVEAGRIGPGQALASRSPVCGPPQPFGNASAARSAAPGARRSRRAEGFVGCARPSAIRFLASETDDSRRSRAGRRYRQ
jgi:alanyl-tRNA synthetase